MSDVRCSCAAELLVRGVPADVGAYRHTVGSCVRTRPLFDLPQSFVRLADHPGGELLEDRELNVKKNSYRFTVSREFAIDMGMVLPTPAEAHARDVAHEAFLARQAAERAQPGPVLTLDALLAHMGWSAAYAAHLLHPACGCTPTGDDPDLCSWALELGFTDKELDRDR